MAPTPAQKAATQKTKALQTLAIDIGGTGLKASVLDPTGKMTHERVRVATPYPLSPQRLVEELGQLIAELPPFDRVSVGFPGMVRAGHILSAPHFVSPDGPGGVPVPKLVQAWNRFELATALEQQTGKPTKVANDADLQGAAVVKGVGLELVITLGTGFGTALFYEGMLLPHMEFAHHPLRKDKTYNEVVGDAARKRLGTKKWRERALESIETMRALTFFDHCYVGGGNAARLGDHLPPGVTTVSNEAGILGGIKLWERTEEHPALAALRRPAAARKRAPAKKVAAARKAPAARKAVPPAAAAPPATAVPPATPQPPPIPPSPA